MKKIGLSLLVAMMSMAAHAEDQGFKNCPFKEKSFGSFQVHQENFDKRIGHLHKLYSDVVKARVALTVESVKGELEWLDIQGVALEGQSEQLNGMITNEYKRHNAYLKTFSDFNMINCLEDKKS